MNDMTHNMKAAQAPTQDQIDHLRKLVDKARVAMLTTIDGNNELRSRPLHTVDMDGDASLWFVVEAASPKAREVHNHEGKVCLTYANAGDQEYVSISGYADIVRDPQKKRAVWNRMIDVWFPNGEQNDDVALLRVVPERAEYWDGPSNTVTQLYAFAKAMATGKKDAFGENAKLKF